MKIIRLTLTTVMDLYEVVFEQKVTEKTMPKSAEPLVDLDGNLIDLLYRSLDPVFRESMAVQSREEIEKGGLPREVPRGGG